MFKLYTTDEIQERIDNEYYYRIYLYKNSKLYHYTDINGFKGIIQSKNFWATDYRYLNDRNEFRIAQTLIPSVVHSFISDDCFENVIVDIIQNELTKLSETAIHNGSFYVTCFSLDPDCLLLWSEFGSKEGCCLEFDPFSLFNKSNYYITHPGKVIYNQEEQVEIIKECFDYPFSKRCNISDYLLSIKRTNAWDQLLLYCKDVALLIRYYSLFMKDEIFAPENEFRIVYSVLDENVIHTEYREKKEIIDYIPYIEIPVDIGNKVQLSNLRINPWSHDNHKKEKFIEICKECNVSLNILESKAILRY